MSDMDKELERLEKEVAAENTASVSAEKKIKTMSGANLKGSSNNELLEFFIGFLLLGGGVYWVLNSFTVTSSWGAGYHFFGMSMPSGVMLIPLLLGIGLMFFMEKKIVGGFIAALGLLIILISLLTSISFHAKYNTLYVYVLMFGMVAAGSGLLIKSLFKKKK